MEGGDRKTIGDASKKLAAAAKTAKDKVLQKKAAEIDKALGAKAGAVVGAVFGAENLWNAVKIGAAFLIVSAIGVMLMGGSCGKFLIGFPVVYALAWLSHVIAGNATVNYWGLEYVIFALLIGLFVGNFIGVPRWLMEAVQTEYYIKTGLVILGAGILFFEILQAGALGIVQAVLVVTVIWYMCFWLAKKFRVDDEFAVILSSAVSICGVSAAIAACGAIQGDKKKLSYVTSLVLIVAVPMMVLMPWAAKAFNMPDAVAGAWLGGTLDTSGSVVAAGALISETCHEGRRHRQVLPECPDRRGGFPYFALVDVQKGRRKGRAAKRGSHLGALSEIRPRLCDRVAGLFFPARRGDRQCNQGNAGCASGRVVRSCLHLHRPGDALHRIGKHGGRPTRGGFSRRPSCQRGLDPAARLPPVRGNSLLAAGAAVTED